jgi:two-component system nitrate/nitrite response regulator NarL
MDETDEPNSEEARKRRRGRILVVDDQPVLLRWATKILGSAGYEIVTATSVHSALAALREDFDVGVFDVDLPDGKGFDVVEALRKAKSQLIPVIMITGNPNQENLGQSVSHGITEFLFKPFEKDELYDAVERALHAKRRWEQRLAVLAKEGRIKPGAPAALEGQEGWGTFGESEISQLLESLATRGGLTERERETLKLMLAGLQNTDIARDLKISANTVKYHVRNVLTKLGMESRTALFRSLLAQADS